MNKQQLAARIWESANKMRSKISADKYKDYILGFIFYKYLSDKEIQFLKDNGATEVELPLILEDAEKDGEHYHFVRDNLGYYIAYDNLFSTWISMQDQFDVSNVRDALSAFDRSIGATHKKVFHGIFQTLQTGLSSLGESATAQTKAISALLKLIKEIPMDGKQDYDVLGFIYEYLIGHFAANAGKKAGEFYTPHEVSVLMSEIVAHHLRGKETIEIYDPTSGSGSLLINIGKSVSKYMLHQDNIKYYAQELKEDTYNLTRMNLVMRGIRPDNILVRNGDTLEDDWPYFDEADPTRTYHPLYVDAVVSNPPYSQQWDPRNKEFDPRYARFGLAPKGKADFAFLLHDLYHLKPEGIMTIVLPHGVLFRGGEEGEIRKNLVEYNHIEAIIGLPSNIFFGTGIPTIIMVLRQKRDNTDVLMIDASKGFIKDGKNNKLRACDIKKIADTVASRKTIDGFSRLVSKEELRENEYNLNIPRTLCGCFRVDRNWDLYASMCGGIPAPEIDALTSYWNAFPSLKRSIFEKEEAAYYVLKSDDVASSIHSADDVQNFETHFADSFSDFHHYLHKTWVENPMDIELGKAQTLASESMFTRLSDIPLVDAYEAYQMLDDAWEIIANDLETIQTEGMDACRIVDPKLVLKKNGDIEKEIQEGWTGRVFPFELVEQELLGTEYAVLKEKEQRLAEIPSLYEELLDSLTEEEKETSVLNDSNDAFVAKEVSNKLKELKKEDSTEENQAFIEKLKQYETLANEEKELKKSIKKLESDLHLLTKKTIETLTDAQILDLLDKKWIAPLLSSIEKLPHHAISDLITQLSTLQEKYTSTCASVEQEITQVNHALADMLEELTGSPFDVQGLQTLKNLLMKA